MDPANNLPYVLSDLDGTIADSSLLINELTAQHIQGYQNASLGRFSLITGRLMGATKFLAQELGIVLPIVSCNGALISDWKTEEIFYVKYLDSKLVTEIIHQASQQGIEPIVYTTKELVGLKNNHRIVMWKEYSASLPPQLRCGILEYDSIEALISALAHKEIKPVQLVLYAAQKIQQEAARKIISQYENQIEAAASFAHVFNITTRGADKLSGLKAWAKLLGLNYRDIIVFGDSYNDIPMLEGVKRGFVVANGIPQAKKVAYKIIPAMTNNGVGETLKRFMESGNYD